MYVVRSWSQVLQFKAKHDTRQAERGGRGGKKERRRRRRRAPETSTQKFRKTMEKVRKVKERVRDKFKRLLGNREYAHERAERENRKRGV